MDKRNGSVLIISIQGNYDLTSSMQFTDVPSLVSACTKNVDNILLHTHTQGSVVGVITEELTLLIIMIVFRIWGYYDERTPFI